MVLPVYAYGQPILKKVGTPITNEYPNLDALIANMWETMYHANGIGLAAPQIGLSIRMFMIDTVQIQEEGEEDKGFKKVFINAEMIEESGDLWVYEEGCLSIPNVNGDVERPRDIKIKYQDENFEEHIEAFSGMTARVIQHEYDHIQGELFVDKLNPLKRRLVQRKLDSIRKGKLGGDYAMKYV